MWLVLKLPNPPLMGDADQHAVVGLDGVRGEDMGDAIVAEDVPVSTTRENNSLEFWTACGSAGDWDKSSVAIRGVSEILGWREVDLESEGKSKSWSHDVKKELRIDKEST